MNKKLPLKQPVPKPKCFLPLVVCVSGDEGDYATESAGERRRQIRSLIVAFTEHLDGVIVEELAEEKGEK